MKKILIFSLAYYPKFVGGAEVAIKEITDHIPDIEFHMVTLRFDSDLPKEEKIGSVHVHRVGWGKRGATVGGTFSVPFYISKIFFVPLAALKGYRLHRRNRFDGFWAMMSYMLFPIVLLRMVGVRVPYAVTIQEGDPFRRVFRRLRILPFLPLLTYGFRHATAVSAISTFLGDWAKRAGFRGSVAVIQNGVDLELFSREYPQGSIDEIKDALDKKMGDVFLVTASRLVHKNAVDVVIRALPLLPPNVHFVVLGAGPLGEELGRLAQKLDVAGRVRFVGQIPYGEIPQYLHASDIFIRPSRSEGMGNSFIEAMAAGLPVIATQEGGIADFLFDEERSQGKPTTGFAVEKDSPEDIVRAVTRVMEHPEKVRAVVRTAQEMSREYDWSRIAARMKADVFEKLTL